jgi:hypothetical protein
VIELSKAPIEDTMKPKRKPTPKIANFVPAIDADVITRINARIAKAHEEIESTPEYRRRREPGGGDDLEESEEA